MVYHQRMLITPKRLHDRADATPYAERRFTEFSARGERHVPLSTIWKRTQRVCPHQKVAVHALTGLPINPRPSAMSSSLLSQPSLETLWRHGPNPTVTAVVWSGRCALMVRKPDGLWHLPGGHVDLGDNDLMYETDGTAAARETYGETGLAILPKDFQLTSVRALGSSAVCGLLAWKVDHVLMATLGASRARPVVSPCDADGGKIILEAAWLDPAEIAQGDGVLPYHRLVLEGLKHSA